MTFEYEYIQLLRIDIGRISNQKNSCSCEQQRKKVIDGCLLMAVLLFALPSEWLCKLIIQTHIYIEREMCLLGYSSALLDFTCIEIILVIKRLSLRRKKKTLLFSFRRIEINILLTTC
jgi:hypothetical protein